MDKIQFFYIDPNYIAYLKKVDPRVPDVVYPGRNKKMLCGAVFQTILLCAFIQQGGKFFHEFSDFQQ